MNLMGSIYSSLTLSTMSTVALIKLCLFTEPPSIESFPSVFQQYAHIYLVDGTQLWWINFEKEEL